MTTICKTLVGPQFQSLLFFNEKSHSFLLLDVACVELSHFVFFPMFIFPLQKKKWVDTYLYLLENADFGGITQLFCILQEQKPILKMQSGTWNCTLMCLPLTLQSRGRTQSTEISWVPSPVFSQEERQGFSWYLPDRSLTWHQYQKTWYSFSGTSTERRAL